MKFKSLIYVLFVLTAGSACNAIQESPQPLDTPTLEMTMTSTATTAPTITPTSTQTPTPTLVSTPEGQIVTDPLLRFSFFWPSNYEINAFIYRQTYSYATIYQKTTHWTKAIILLDLDITDQGSLPLDLILSTTLVNLDFFNATAEETGEIVPMSINQYEAAAIDFTGKTNGYPIQGQIIGFQSDNNHVFVGISWFDISTDPNIWENQGKHLFEYVLHSVSFEP